MAVADLATLFEASDFSPGKWHMPETREDGVIEMGWWEAHSAVAVWEQALYDHNIIDADSGYLAEDNVVLVKATIKEPALVAGFDLTTLRRVLTFLARAERHADGGWFEEAFLTGMAQAATRRLGELGR